MEQQPPPSPDGRLNPDQQRVQALMEQVEELELKLRHQDELLTTERERSSRARKKVRQLFAKLLERDEAIREMRAALEAALGGGGGHRLGRAASASSGAKGKQAKEEESQPAPKRAGLTKQELAAREREEIVMQLEGHLAQMRRNLKESEREVRELQERMQTKEAEWAHGKDDGRSPESVKAHWQTLNMLRQQAQEKQQFAQELIRKTKLLEDQVAQQRALLEDLGTTRVANPEAVGGRAGGAAASSRAPAPAPARYSGSSSVNSSSEAESQDEGATGRAGVSAEEEAAEKEALCAFLAAAGAAGELVCSRPALRALFEIRPLRLAAGVIEDCDPDERMQALSLFAAWAAVAGREPRSISVSDICLKLQDVTELKTTLETCGAGIQDVEMIRCQAGDATTIRVLLEGLATQPLRQLNLSYNALGPIGVAALVNVVPAWTETLEQLSLEMNGLGDSGVEELAKALGLGLLPRLRSLELGWNELSAASGLILAPLLRGEDPQSAAIAGENPDAEPAGVGVPCLERLGLGGNGLGSEGAKALTSAALKHQPERELELDLSMNHVGAQPLLVLAEWIESVASDVVGLSLGLEWNSMDSADMRSVQRLLSALAQRTPTLRRSPGTSGRPLVRLANNELVDLDPVAVLSQSHGFIAC